MKRELKDAQIERDILKKALSTTMTTRDNEVFEFIEIRYNRKRKHSYLGYLTPKDFELNKLLNVA